MDFLSQLGIRAEDRSGSDPADAANPGACFGLDDWSSTVDAGILDCINPSTGEVIARVHTASEADYERVMYRVTIAGDRPA